MSENVRRSSRLQDKRRKLVAKVRGKKSCRIVDDDSSSSDDSRDDKFNNSITSNNTSFTGNRNPIVSLGGNFTTM